MEKEPSISEIRTQGLSEQSNKLAKLMENPEEFKQKYYRQLFVHNKQTGLLN